MDSWASFRFFSSLNDFLPLPRKGVAFPFGFSGLPAVKDTIEAIGVPHPEIGIILINSCPAHLASPLQARDQVEVYPVISKKQWPADYFLLPPAPEPARFILDVHLGKLARNLRLLGFDACYRNDYTDKTLADLASREGRRVLTRDIGLLKHKAITWGYWLRSQDPEKQLIEVMAYYQLQARLAPFTRCLACNGPIEAVPKEAVWDALPPKTRLYFQDFFQCSHCKRVYWKGSHYDRMLAFVAQLPPP